MDEPTVRTYSNESSESTTTASIHSSWRYMCHRQRFILVDDGLFQIARKHEKATDSRRCPCHLHLFTILNIHEQSPNTTVPKSSSLTALAFSQHNPSQPVEDPPRETLWTVPPQTCYSRRPFEEKGILCPDNSTYIPEDPQTAAGFQA